MFLELGQYSLHVIECSMAFVSCFFTRDVFLHLIHVFLASEEQAQFTFFISF